VGGDAIGQLRDAWVSSCLLYDEQQAEQILSQAFSLYPPETVSLELIQKAVAQIGEGWYRGDVTVQQEHYCSELAVRRLEALIMSAPPPSRPGRILAACPPREHHTIGLLLLTYLLRRRGWDVVYLGANVPAERLETTIELTEPQLLILSAQQLHTAASVLDVAEVLKRHGVSFAYGGLIFNVLPNLRHRIPGHYLGESLELAPRTVEDLMTFPRAILARDGASPGRNQEFPEGDHTTSKPSVARDHFLTRQALIEGDVARTMGHAELSQQRLAMINRELALNITAALTLGDLAFAGADLGWIEGLMENRQMPGALLKGYLSAYYRATRKYLDARGKPIVDWLGKLVENSNHEPSTHQGNTESVTDPESRR
jgi:methanogenic corrinoid protein MtbC1